MCHPLPFVSIKTTISTTIIVYYYFSYSGCNSSVRYYYTLLPFPQMLRVDGQYQPTKFKIKAHAINLSYLYYIYTLALTNQI